MALMISSVFKPAVTRVITPIARGLLALGITPNSVSILGALGVVISALSFYPSGNFFLGTMLICFFSLSDLFDGAMARLSDAGTTRWGSFLDSTIDRISDCAVLIGVIIALDNSGDDLVPIVVLALATGTLIPYIRAKAESLGTECSGGLAERSERLMLALFAIGFEGLGIPFALSVGMWVLAIIGTITVVQRIMIVHKATHSS